MVLIATFCTAFAFSACDFFSTGDNGGSTSSENNGGNGETGNGNSSGNNGSSGNGSTGGNSHTCVFVFTKKVDGCETNGYDLYTCKDPTCGKTEQHNSYAPVGHDYKHIEKPATCTSNRYESDTCTRCGKEKNKRDWPNTKLDHAYSWVETKKATCTAEGVRTGTCPDCGATDTESIAKLKHTFGEYVSDNNATCVKNGTKTAKCSVCGSGDTVVEEGTATGVHIYGEYKSNGDGNCQKDCTGTAKCKTCNKTDTKTLVGVKGDHDMVWTMEYEWCNEYAKNGKCKLCNYFGYEQGKIYDGPQCQYGTAVKTKQATCTEDGYKGVACVKCGKISKSETYPALGHNTDSEGVCTRCGELVGVCKEVIYLKQMASIEDSRFVVVDLGTIYLELIVIDPEYEKNSNDYYTKMKFALFVVQTYTVNGQTVTNRQKADLQMRENYNDRSFYCVMDFYNVADGCYFKSHFGFDYTIDSKNRSISIYSAIHDDGYDYGGHIFYVEYRADDAVVKY